MTTLREFIDRTAQYSSKLECLILEGEDFADPFASHFSASPTDLWLKLVRSTARYFEMPKEDESVPDYAARMLRAPPSGTRLRFGDKEILHREVIVMPREDGALFDWGEIGTIGICEMLPESQGRSLFPNQRYLIRVGERLQSIDAHYNLLVVLEKAGRVRYSPPAAVTEAATDLKAPEPRNFELEDFYDCMEQLMATRKKVNVPVDVPINMHEDTSYSAARRFKASKAAKLGAKNAGQKPGSPGKEVRQVLHEYFMQRGLYDTLGAARNFLAHYGKEGEDLLKANYATFYYNLLRFSEVAAIVARQA